MSKSIHDALGRLNLSLLILDRLPVSDEQKKEIAKMFTEKATKEIGSEIDKLEQDVKSSKEKP